MTPARARAASPDRAPPAGGKTFTRFHHRDAASWDRLSPAEACREILRLYRARRLHLLLKERSDGIGLDDGGDGP